MRTAARNVKSFAREPEEIIIRWVQDGKVGLRLDTGLRNRRLRATPVGPRWMPVKSKYHLRFWIAEDRFIEDGEHKLALKDPLVDLDKVAQFVRDNVSMAGAQSGEGK